MMKNVGIMPLFCSALLYQQSEASYTNFEIKRYEVCNNTQGQIKYFPSISNENSGQYLSYNISSPIPWGDNLGVTCLIQTKVIGGTFVELFTIREKDICKAANKYLGEFWYDIERASLMLVGLCPIREGRYSAHHVLLDFQKISLQTFPFGTLRFTIKAVDHKNTNVNMWCVMAEVENNFN